MVLAAAAAVLVMARRRRSVPAAAMSAAAAGLAPQPSRPVTAYHAPSSAPPPPGPGPAGATAAGTTMLGGRLGHLRFTDGPLAGQRFAIPPDGLIIGREPGPGGVTIPDTRVSRRHCRVAAGGSGVVLADQGSTNGTFVGSPSSGRIQEQELRPGDMVYLGSDGAIAFTFEP